LNVTHPHPQG